MENQEMQDPIENAQIQVPVDNQVVEMLSTRTLMSAQRELTDFLLDSRQTERFIDAAKKMREISIRLTMPEDWVQFGESMHLQDKRLASLSNHLQALFQINIQFLPTQVTVSDYKQIVTEILLDEHRRPIKDENGKNKTEEIEIDVKEYICTGGIMVEEVRAGQISRKRIIQPITGAATSSDPLWAKRNGQYLDPNQIQPSLIRKKAEANYRGNCLRYFWGLKGVDRKELEFIFGDTGKFADSTVRGAKQQQTPEAQGILGDIWKRVVDSFDGQAAKAKDWLKGTTSFPAGTNRSTGEAYNGFDGYTDIMRVKPGSKSLQKIEKALEKREKEKGLAVDGANKGEKEAGSLSVKNYNRYKSSLDHAPSIEAILIIENQFGKNKTLSSGHVQDLVNLASARYNEFEEAKKNG